MVRQDKVLRHLEDRQEAAVLVDLATMIEAHQEGALEVFSQRDCRQMEAGAMEAETVAEVMEAAM